VAKKLENGQMRWSRMTESYPKQRESEQAKKRETEERDRREETKREKHRTRPVIFSNTIFQ